MFTGGNSTSAVEARKYKGLGDMIRRRLIKGISILNRAAVTGAAVILAVLVAVPAAGQQRFLGATNNVTIDYGALNSDRPLRLGPGDTTFLNSTGKIILSPPSRSPVSRLQGSLANRTFVRTVPVRSAKVVRAPVKAIPKEAKVKTPVPLPAAAPKVTEAMPIRTTPTVLVPPPTAEVPVAPATPTALVPRSPAELPVQTATPSPPLPPIQIAAKPPGRSPSPEAPILFEADSPDLSDAAKSTLDALAARLNADESLRIQLWAFAAGTSETAPAARRLSLKRALNVRAHLVERKVRNTRMDVRALGIKSTSGPSDRVDAVIVQK
jgi:outer membrane protein OmpA-like peptidoglycan-associated protein